jgi:phage/plasmid primase-like uncharacterized protein
MLLNKNKIKIEAAGRWLEILNALSAGKYSEAIENIGRHVDCPLSHGGKNDFRFFYDAEETGKAICTCGHFDVFQLLMIANDWSFHEMLSQVHNYLYGEVKS